MKPTNEIEEEEGGRPTREAQLLALAAEGLTDREICIELGIGLGTVDTYWRRIKKRYDVVSRTEAVARALNVQWAAKATGLQEDILAQANNHRRLESELQARLADEMASNETWLQDLGGLLEFAWRTRLLLASLGAVIWWADAEPPWTLRWISDSNTRFGISTAEWSENASVLKLVGDNDKVAFEAGLILASRTPSNLLERTYRLKTETGDYKEVREILIRGFDPVKNNSQIVGIQIDISTRD